jgi:sortase A
MPGEQGNFAVAGHRVGRGSPFLDLDRMRPGDPIVIETAEGWFTYRVLGDPATGDFASPSGIPGQHVVTPADVDVIAPVPGGPPDAVATGAYLTLTTCHPKYSARQRLIVHAELDDARSRADVPDGPAALREG